MLGIVHLHQFSRARQMLVVEARKPETQRRSAQHCGPGVALRILQRPYRMVGAEQRERPRLIQPAVALGIHETPVIDADREVEGKAIHAGEIEVEDAADPAALEDRVIAEQIGVHRAARQVRKPVLRLEAQLRVEQLRARRVEEGTHLARRAAPPFRPAGILAITAVGPPREMHARKQRAKFGTIGGAGILDRSTR